MFRRTEGPWEIGGAEFHSFGGQLSRCGFKGRPFREQLVLGSLAIGYGFKLDILPQIGDFTIVEVYFLMK